MLDRRPNRRVLIVEDEKDFRRLMCRLFALSGWEPVEARDAQEASECLASLRPHYFAAVCDLMLPDQSGVEVIKLIRAARYPTRIVVYTASYKGSPLVRAAIAAGADGVLYKPASIVDELIPVILGERPGDEVIPIRSPAPLPLP